MKKNKIIAVLGWVTLITFTSCDTFLEEDISNDKILPISPVQGDEIEGNTINFQWSFVEDTDAYRVQVLSDIPNTGNVLDSLLQTTSLQINLPSGNYSWRARGENFAYVTPFFDPTDFSVIFSDNLASQNVILTTPSDDLFTNNTSLTFTWESLEAANSYDFELLRNLNGIITVIQENTELNSIQIDSNIYDEDAQYIWRVKAINNESQTAYSERSIFIDRSIPGAPTLISPIQNTIFETNIIDFDWLIGSDTGNVQSERNSVVEFSELEDFETIIDTIIVTASEVSFTFNNSGIIYWRVVTKDIAGNTSAYSETWSFMIN